MYLLYCYVNKYMSPLGLITLYKSMEVVDKQS